MTGSLRIAPRATISRGGWPATGFITSSVPACGAPQGSARDLKKIWAKLVRFFKGPRAAGENLKIVTLLQLPLHRFRLVRWMNRVVILATLRWLMWHEGIRQPIASFMIPTCRWRQAGSERACRFIIASTIMPPYPMSTLLRSAPWMRN